MNSARSASDSRYRILAYLLTAALLLSTGLNCYLLGGSNSPALRLEAADAEELAAVETELLQTRSQLARCRSSAVAPDTLAMQTHEPAQEAGLLLK